MSPRRRPARRDRGGFSMLEAVIALAVMSMAAVLVTARASVMLDQIATHAAFQRFQSGLLAVRARAFGLGEDIAVTPEALSIPTGWSFRTDTALVAHGDGRCTGGEVELVGAGRPRALLRPAGGGACRYLRAR